MFMALIGATVLAQETKPVRALWVVRDVLRNRSAIDGLIDDAAKGKFTDLYVQVRARGDAFYPSRYAPAAENMDTIFDPLAYLLQQSAGRPFRVHAWLNVFYVWSAAHNPGDSFHVVYRHPDWSAVSESGRSMVDEGTRKLQSRNLEGIFLTPAADEYKGQFLAIVEELLTRYPLAGIHLDYIRYPDARYDYSMAMRAKFILSYHVDPVSTSVAEDRWLASRWKAFRQQELTHFVEGVRQTTKRLRPAAILSAAVFADPSDAQDRVLQSWTEWIQSGAIDYAVAMNYAADAREFENRLNTLRLAVGDSIMAERVIVGVALYNQSVRGALDKLKRIRSYRVRGTSVFSYEILRTDRAYFDRLIKESP